MIEVKTFTTIEDVPSEWDILVKDNIYMTKSFLSFMERVDNYNQKYYMIYDDNQLDTIFMTYVMDEYNIGMFTKFKIIKKLTMVAPPLSITRPGIIHTKCFNEALKIIENIKGAKLILNLGDINLKGWAKGVTFPKCVFKNRFNSFEHYLNSLRSNYRHRYKKALEKSKALKLEYLEDNTLFNEEMYECYLQVFEKSEVKIEKHSIDFFRGSCFKIFTLSNEDKVVGVCQLLENDKELIFEFVGVDYNFNAQYDTYHRILLEIIKYGIENNFDTIDFGQTADESKLKLGAQYEYLYVYLNESNKLKNFINIKLSKYLSYKPITTNFKIFKEE